jgi:hypothetical protein
MDYSVGKLIQHHNIILSIITSHTASDPFSQCMIRSKSHGKLPYIIIILLMELIHQFPVKDYSDKRWGESFLKFPVVTKYNIAEYRKS